MRVVIDAHALGDLGVQTRRAGCDLLGLNLDLVHAWQRDGQARPELASIGIRTTQLGARVVALAAQLEADGLGLGLQAEVTALAEDGITLNLVPQQGWRIFSGTVVGQYRDLARTVQDFDRELIREVTRNPLALANPTLLVTRAAIVPAGGWMTRHGLADIKIGFAGNRFTVRRDGSIAVKIPKLKIAVIVDPKHDAWKLQCAGLGAEHTREGAYGIIADLGIDAGILHAHLKTEMTYNADTHVLSDEVSAGASVDGAIGAEFGRKASVDIGQGSVTTTDHYSTDVLNVHHVESVTDVDGQQTDYRTQTVTTGPAGTYLATSHETAVQSNGTVLQTETEQSGIKGNATLGGTIGEGDGAVSIEIHTQDAGVLHEHILQTATTSDGERTVDEHSDTHVVNPSSEDDQ